jgi:hypothetical protein
MEGRELWDINHKNNIKAVGIIYFHVSRRGEMADKNAKLQFK